MLFVPTHSNVNKLLELNLLTTKCNNIFKPCTDILLDDVSSDDSSTNDNSSSSTTPSLLDKFFQ